MGESAKPIRVLSLGAGVQSTALLLMSIRGELPRVDHCIFSDTQYEPPAVYEHLTWLRGEAAKAGIPVHMVTRGNLRDDAIEFRSSGKSSDGKRYASIPLFVLNPDGSQGLIRRQCTSEYKIVPIENFIKRDILGLKFGQRAPREIVVEQWMGITKDEIGRAKHPVSKKRRDAEGNSVDLPLLWKSHAFPLINLTLWHTRDAEGKSVRHAGNFNGPSLWWSRQDCIRWLAENYPARTFPRSACICCPYRSNAEWRHMRDTDPASFADAVAFDREIRVADAAGHEARTATGKARKALIGQPFIHRTMKPLGEVDLDDDGPGLWDGVADNECEGMCGV